MLNIREPTEPMPAPTAILVPIGLPLNQEQAVRAVRDVRDVRAVRRDSKVYDFWGVGENGDVGDLDDVSDADSCCGISGGDGGDGCDDSKAQEVDCHEGNDCGMDCHDDNDCGFRPSKYCISNDYSLKDAKTRPNSASDAPSNAVPGHDANGESSHEANDFKKERSMSLSSVSALSASFLSSAVRALKLGEDKGTGDNEVTVDRHGQGKEERRPMRRFSNFFRESESSYDGFESRLAYNDGSGGHCVHTANRNTAARMPRRSSDFCKSSSSYFASGSPPNDFTEQKQQRRLSDGPCLSPNRNTSVRMPRRSSAFCKTYSSYSNSRPPTSVKKHKQQRRNSDMVKFPLRRLKSLDYVFSELGNKETSNNYTDVSTTACYLPRANSAKGKLLRSGSNSGRSGSRSLNLDSSLRSYDSIPQRSLGSMGMSQRSLGSTAVSSSAASSVTREQRAQMVHQHPDLQQLLAEEITDSGVVTAAGFEAVYQKFLMSDSVEGKILELMEEEAQKRQDEDEDCAGAWYCRGKMERRGSAKAIASYLLSVPIFASGEDSSNNNASSTNNNAAASANNVGIGNSNIDGPLSIDTSNREDNIAPRSRKASLTYTASLQQQEEIKKLIRNGPISLKAKEQEGLDWSDGRSADSVASADSLESTASTMSTLSVISFVSKVAGKEGKSRQHQSDTMEHQTENSSSSSQPNLAPGNLRSSHEIRRDSIRNSTGKTRRRKSQSQHSLQEGRSSFSSLCSQTSSIKIIQPVRSSSHIHSFPGALLEFQTGESIKNVLKPIETIDHVCIPTQESIPADHTNDNGNTSSNAIHANSHLDKNSRHVENDEDDDGDESAEPWLPWPEKKHDYDDSSQIISYSADDILAIATNKDDASQISSQISMYSSCADDDIVDIPAKENESNAILDEEDSAHDANDFLPWPTKEERYLKKMERRASDGTYEGVGNTYDRVLAEADPRLCKSARATF